MGEWVDYSPPLPVQVATREHEPPPSVPVAVQTAATRLEPCGRGSVQAPPQTLPPTTQATAQDGASWLGQVGRGELGVFGYVELMNERRYHPGQLKAPHPHVKKDEHAHPPVNEEYARGRRASKG